MLWHNRNKYTGRPKLLYLFSRRQHCSVTPTWRASLMLRHATPPHAPRVRVQLGTQLAHVGVGRGASSDAAVVHPWIAFAVDSSYRRLACNGTGSETVDLSSKSTLARLGLLEQLGNASYIRPEAAIRAAQRERRRAARRKGRRRGGSSAGVDMVKSAKPIAEDWPRLYIHQKEGTD